MAVLVDCHMALARLGVNRVCEEVHGIPGVKPVSLLQDKRTVVVRAVTPMGLLITLVPQSDALSPA